MVTYGTLFDLLLFVYDVVVKGLQSENNMTTGTTIKKSDKTDPITAVQDSIGKHDSTIFVYLVYAC